jgi:hypothetical protein
MAVESWLKNHNFPPTYNELYKKGYKSLASAIREYGHDLYELYKEMGYEVTRSRKPYNYWNNHGNLINGLKILVENFLKENKRLPKWQEISDINSTLAHKVTQKGGLIKFYEELNILGLYPIRKQPNYWKNLDNVKKEIQSVINKFGHFPTSIELRKLSMFSLEIAIQKYHGGLERMSKIMGYSPTKSIEGFKYFLENEKTARLVLKKFGDDKAVFADIMAIIYEGRVSSREQLLKLLDAPSLKEYLGDFIRPIGGIPDLIETATHVLPFDKGEKIRDIIYKKALENRDDKLGPKPLKERREVYLIELSDHIRKIESLKEKNQPHTIVLKSILTELFSDTNELYEMYENGIEGLARRIKNPEFENG